MTDTAKSLTIQTSHFILSTEMPYYQYHRGGNHLPSTGLKATWWPGSGLDTYRRDWTTKVIVHVYQRFLEGYYH